MNKIYLDINKYSQYVITGEIGILGKNSLNKITLRRINAEYVNDSILISFAEETKINIFERIEYMAKTSNISLEMKEAVNALLINYKNEQKDFQEFSNKAKNIREDKFQDNPELIKEFEDFTDVLNNALVRKLYKRQLLSAYHMAFSQNSCNFAVPGAGKTSIVYGAYAYLKSLSVDDPKHVDKLLVIGPLSSFDPWEKEYKDCFGIFPESQRLSGNSPGNYGASIAVTMLQKENHLYSRSPKELTIMNYSALQFITDKVKDFLNQNKVMVIVDEAHRIKNTEGVWGQAAIEIAKEANSRIVLTGTPAPNGYEDLFNLIQFIYPYKFREIMRTNNAQLRDMTRSNLSIENDRVKNFVENIKPFFIRINKKELNLPEPIESEERVEMDTLQRKIYDYVFNLFSPHFEDNPSATATEVLSRARLLRLRQACTNPSLLLKPLIENLEISKDGDGYELHHMFENESIDFDDSELVEDIIQFKETAIPNKFVKTKEIYENKIKTIDGKVIVWTIFLQNAFQFQKYLTDLGIESRLLIGSVEQTEREDIIKKFNNPENNDFNLVIANPFSVSESISLHKGCQNAIYMERDYNAANYIQSKNRIHRVGMPKGITANYYQLISERSIDEDVYFRLSEKVIRMEEIIDQDIPLFDRIDDNDETEIITSIMNNSYGYNQ